MSQTLLQYSAGALVPACPPYPPPPRLRKRQNKILGSRTIVNAVIEEREFEFKPSFDVYLKEMESIREKKQSLSLRKREGLGIKRVEEKGNLDGSEGKLDKEKIFEKVEKEGDYGEITVSREVKKQKRKPMAEGRKSDESETFGVERAAFKTLEEYGEDDIVGKPRVSRVDMEERIQKLARSLNGADIDMPEWMFSKMMRSAKIRFSDHSILRIIQILGKLGNWRRVLQVIEWMESRERFKSHKLRYIYTAALDALGKARRPVEALNLFQAMQHHMSTYPDMVAYHSISVTLGKAGHMKELFDVIDIMRSPPKKKFKSGIFGKWDPRLEPDIVVYNAVLNACVQRKKWEGAFWVLQQLQQQGQKPSSSTYGLVMEVMFECGKYDLVHDFFKRMQRSCIPNALTYKVLVNTFWKEGKIDEAISAVEDMERRGIVGTASVYYDLACCLCSAGRCQEALKQIDKVCRVATKPLVVTYTGLIQACLDSEDIKSAAYVFNHMQKFCSPNLITYNIMLKAFLDHGMFEAAKDLFLGLLDNDNSTSNKLDRRDKVLPDSYTFNSMLDACVTEHKWDDLELVYSQMLKHGQHFNAKRHLQIILKSCHAGKVDILETTWNHLVQADRAVPALLIKEKFRLKLELGDVMAALSCITGHPPAELEALSMKSWLRFFTENGHCFSSDTIEALVKELSVLVSRGENLALQSLLTSCIEFLRTRAHSAGNLRTETITRSRLEKERALVY